MTGTDDADTASHRDIRIREADYPTESLGQRQELFSACMGLLLVEIQRKGLRARTGHVWRDWGAPKGVHPDKLAVDLNLFDPARPSADQFLELTSDHAELGAFWKELHPLCRWGGDFTSPDGNHYSIAWQGKA
jgi:hypothetical protein